MNTRWRSCKRKMAVPRISNSYLSPLPLAETIKGPQLCFAVKGLDTLNL